ERQIYGPPTPRPARLVRVFVEVFAIHLGNAVVAVFFVAFFPQFLNPFEPIAPQVPVLGAVYIAVAIVVDITYVLTTSALSTRFMRSAKAQRRSGRIAAGTYVALGVAALASGIKRP